MMDKVRVLCKYIGNRDNIIIGGVPVTKGVAATVAVDEYTFNFLKKGVECGWLKIVEHNYDDFCKSRLRKERLESAATIIEKAAQSRELNEKTKTEEPDHKEINQPSELKEKAKTTKSKKKQPKKIEKES